MSNKQRIFAIIWSLIFLIIAVIFTVKINSQTYPQNKHDSTTFYNMPYYAVFPKVTPAIKDDLVPPSYTLEKKQDVVFDTNSKKIIISIVRVDFKIKDTIILIDTSTNLKYIYTRQRQER